MLAHPKIHLLQGYPRYEMFCTEISFFQDNSALFQEGSHTAPVRYPERKTPSVFHWESRLHCLMYCPTPSESSYQIAQVIEIFKDVYFYKSICVVQSREQFLKSK